MYKLDVFRSLQLLGVGRNPDQVAVQNFVCIFRVSDISILLCCILSSNINQDICTTWMVSYVFGDVVDYTLKSVVELSEFPIDAPLP